MLRALESRVDESLNEGGPRRVRHGSGCTAAAWALWIVATRVALAAGRAAWVWTEPFLTARQEFLTVRQELLFWIRAVA